MADGAPAAPGAPSAILITGGARSGKSRYALARAAAWPGPHRYVATALPLPGDAEWQARIARHRAERAGRGWETVEAGADLVPALDRLDGGAAVIDCLTLWLAAQGERHAWREAAVLDELEALALAVGRCPARLAIVTNEVGSGVVPEHAAGRAFRDLQGLANQRLAEACSEVVLCVCGRPLLITPCAPCSPPAAS